MSQSPKIRALKRKNNDTVDNIVENAMSEHQRKKSLFTAIQSDLGLHFDEEDVKKISKNVMKKIFAKKQNN